MRIAQTIRNAIWKQIQSEYYKTKHATKLQNLDVQQFRLNINKRIASNHCNGNSHNTSNNANNTKTTPTKSTTQSTQHASFKRRGFFKKLKTAIAATDAAAFSAGGRPPEGIGGDSRQRSEFAILSTISNQERRVFSKFHDFHVPRLHHGKP